MLCLTVGDWAEVYIAQIIVGVRADVHIAQIRGEVSQKTAYEIGVRLVGSEMCIRDRHYIVYYIVDFDLFNRKRFTHTHITSQCMYM